MPVSTRIWPRRGLYAITPDGLDSPRLLRAVEAALRGGAVMLQYRSKSVDSNQRREQASDLLALCERYQATVIVNDDPLLAQALGTGVHLGEHDSAVADARALLGSGAIIGASCYDDPGRAERAARDGADYLAFGAFHPSTTKPHARRASPQLLQEAARFGLPRVAIGGITADNARPLIEAGADLLAVVSAVFDAPDIEAAARRFAQLFQD